MTSPLVSVVLSVYNGGPDLPEAIDTILAQTFTDFEVIAIDDGSTDGTAKLLDNIGDPRMRVVHQENMGFARALNRGISLARGRYIARQDHDDWAKPTRFESQVAFLEEHPHCALVGTRAEIWVGNRPTNRNHDHPVDNASLQFELLFNNPFVHSSIMMRKAALDVVGAYSIDPAHPPAEDYELWSRLARRYEVANLPDRLTIYREVPNSMSRTGPNVFQDKCVLISAANLAAAVGEARPNRHHWDLAAITNGAPGAMSRRPSIASMCRVIEEAGARIHKAAPGSDVPERVAILTRNVRYEYRLRRTGLYRLRPAVRFLRGVLGGSNVGRRPMS